MSVALPQILQPESIAGVINRLKLVNTTIQDLLGLRGSLPVDPFPVRAGSYDIYDSTRRVANARQPGTAAGIVKKQPVGNVQLVIPRSHDSMLVEAEYAHKLRKIGGPAGQNDVLGEDYILRQIGTLGETVNNLKEFQAAALCRGKYYYQINGDQLEHSFTSTNAMHTVDFQLPAGNLSKLDMLGGGDILATSWDNAAAPIITDLYQIDAAFQQLTGRRLKRVGITSIGWGYVQANTQVQAVAGSVNRVFETLTRNENDNTFIARLHGIPWLEWYITDEGLDVGTTAGSTPSFVKLIEDDHAVFLTEPDGEMMGWAEFYEPLARWEGDPIVERPAEYYWATPLHNPSGWQLFELYNRFPILKVPKRLAYGLIKY